MPSITEGEVEEVEDQNEIEGGGRILIKKSIIGVESGHLFGSCAFSKHNTRGAFSSGGPRN